MNNVSKYLMVVTSGAKDGRDAEYNEWYDSTHIHDVCAVPGITSGQRWDAMPEASINPPPAPYLAIYEIDADDPTSATGELMRRAQAGEISHSDAIDLDTAKIWIYKQH